MHIHLFRTSFTAIALALTALAQSPTVVPNGFANVEGNTNNTFPWSRAAASMRIQFIYDSTHFTGQTANYPILINRLRFRADAATTTTTWPGGSWPQVQIDLSTAPVDFLTPSTTFASNHGADQLTVLNGPVTVQGGAGNGLGVPGPWYIDIPLTTPFLYNPTTGSDLTVDIMLTGTGWTGTSRAADHQSTGSMVTRVYDSTSNTPNGTTGLIATNFGAVMEVSYTPAPGTGLYASFTATPRTGASPLAVQFTDLSVTGAPGGITSWAWDVNGDAIVDYTTQNPLHNYATCGSYTVSLTVNDGSNPAATLTRTNYIVTDNVTPNFTWSHVGPSMMQFTDTSTPTPTAWAWDFNGDAITDSTVQNPVWAFPTACAPVTVSLAASRLCRGPFNVSKTVMVSDSIESVRDGNTTTSTGSGILFDVNVTNPLGISICALETMTGAAAPTAITVNGFITPNTYVGATGTIANPSQGLWRQFVSYPTVGTGTVMVRVPLATPLYLAPGSYGMLLYSTGASARYTSGGPVTYTNADLTLSTFAVQATPFTSGLIASRIGNVALHYSSCMVGGDAGYGFFGAGCAGAMGIPGNTASALPKLNQTMVANVSNLPQNAAFFWLGFSRTTSAFGPLPFNMTGLGAPNCFGRVRPDSVLLLVGAGNTASFNLSIPNNPGLLCATFYSQGLSVDPAANALGGVATDAAAAIVGQ